MSKKKIFLAIVIFIIIFLIAEGYYSSLDIKKLRQKEFIISTTDLGNNIFLEERMKLHPQVDKLIIYRNVVVTGIREQKSAPIKFMVKLSEGNSEVTIKYPSYADFAVDRVDEVKPPQYTIYRLLGFYRISDGEKNQWLKTVPRSTFGDDIEDYVPSESNKYALPPLLL